MNNRIEKIVLAMSKIYIVFCFPQITTDLNTGKETLTYVWQNESMRKAYNQLNELLILEKKLCQSNLTHNNKLGGNLRIIAEEKE